METVTIDFDNIKLDKLKNLWGGTLADHDLDDDDYMVLASKMANLGDVGIQYLLNMLHGGNEIRTRAILFALSTSQQDRKAMVKIFSSYLDDKRPLVVSEAIDGLIQVKDQSHKQQVLSLLKHPSEYVRGAVLRYVRCRLDDNTAFKILVAALADPHYIVRENAIDELAELGKPEAISYFKELLADSHPHVRLAAKTALLEGSR
jgi:HEAT repeat protein